MPVKILNAKIKNTSLNPFTPRFISNCIFWVDGNDETTLTKDSSNNVSQWDDKSDFLYHLTQGTGSAQPLYVPNSLNNKGIIRFAGPPQFMSVANFQIGSVMTVFVAGFYPTTPHFLIEQGFNFNSNDGFIFYGFGAPPAWIRNAGYFVTVPSLSNWIGFVPTTAHMIYDGNRLSIYRRNVLKRTNVQAIPNNLINDTLYINRHATTLYGKGDMGEIIIYDRALNDNEVKRIYAYLNKKWLNI